ncbi:MAG TPA: 4a-hydroxytetrahydrobiopterin dehydratase [Candidatus Diapherotrites archaeon]|uniref:Putative pterin-4-alpha-carbinolamine dehydratase n=1 Tax=Candidatus Iainarchaeum sp. TaxID=3101447 RepID=A0A7J4JGB6_9ARCH|nr:4a-hydroxytetrahydrobiopterin dehydratase [Candidatus Diapherotrites archaeon]HIH16803.1 4a-hydroxytetrahydrobiopterin dehydratase [Candidatus Diapherotrites archaeon]
MDLASKRCKPCEGGVKPFTEAQARFYHAELGTWDLGPDAKSISRAFKFKDFKENMAFVNKVAELAESEGHHPDMEVKWNRLTLRLSSHAIGGLSENDFVLAAKIDALQQTTAFK